MTGVRAELAADGTTVRLIVDEPDVLLELCAVIERLNRGRLYKGELPADSILAPTAPITSSGTGAVAYGVGNWHLYNKRQAEAEAIFRRIMGSGQWASFGYIAAEAELARMK